MGQEKNNVFIYMEQLMNFKSIPPPTDHTTVLEEIERIYTEINQEIVPPDSRERDILRGLICYIQEEIEKKDYKVFGFALAEEAVLIYLRYKKYRTFLIRCLTELEHFNNFDVIKIIRWVDKQND